MSIIFKITDQLFLGNLGMVSFYNHGDKYGIAFSEYMQPIAHICKEVKRK